MKAARRAGLAALLLALAGGAARSQSVADQAPAQQAPADEAPQAEASDSARPDCDAAGAACTPEETSAAPAAAEPRIEAPFGKAWLGAGDGDVTLIVFADYACPACREAQPVIDQLVAADPKLKVVYRILVNEEEGRQAALTSLAVARLANADWSRFHHALDAGGAPNARSISAALAAAGIDPKSLPPLDEAALVDGPIRAELDNNDMLIARRQGTAIPAWVLGDGKALNGFDAASLKAAIARARAHR